MLNKAHSVDDSSLFLCFFDSLRQVLQEFCMITIQMPAHENLKKDNSININITYLLTPWSRVLFEKLTGFATSQ
jgi:hypothetical protein